MAEKSLGKAYEPQASEARWYKYWLDRDYFRAEDSSGKPQFSIVIPPPNVTGMLHMGHALNNTLQDVMTRYRRMQGYNALWMPGPIMRGSRRRMSLNRNSPKKASPDMI